MPVSRNFLCKSPALMPHVCCPRQAMREGAVPDGFTQVDLPAFMSRKASVRSAQRLLGNSSSMARCTSDDATAWRSLRALTCSSDCSCHCWEGCRPELHAAVTSRHAAAACAASHCQVPWLQWPCIEIATLEFCLHLINGVKARSAIRLLPLQIMQVALLHLSAQGRGKRSSGKHKGALQRQGQRIHICAP